MMAVLWHVYAFVIGKLVINHWAVAVPHLRQANLSKIKQIAMRDDSFKLQERQKQS